MAITRVYDDRCFLGLVDIVGHGRDAHTLACSVREYLEQNLAGDPVTVMQSLHEQLLGSRGAVAAFCRLDLRTREVSYVGVGNIVVRVLGPKPVRFVARDGILGSRIRRPVEQRTELCDHDVLVMHSDGIREHFDPLDCAGLFDESAEAVATGLLRQFGKRDDDASCIAARLIP